MIVDEDQLRDQLENLKKEHKELDREIETLVSSGAVDFIKVQRLKKRKLQLKDMIRHIESDLLPDIIA